MRLPGYIRKDRARRAGGRSLRRAIPPGADMHGSDLPSSPLVDSGIPWYRELSRYHWFVLLVAALGWMFDTMDQQLFNLARGPALNQLTNSSMGAKEFGGIVTAIFIIGWATGGIIFGIMGDRVGRAKTMMLTILI